MTAAELYEVVKDVPREAWPNGVHYDWNVHGPKRAKHWHDGDMRMSDTTAELAFIGSMTAWLMNRNVFASKSQFDESYWTIDMNNVSKRSGNYRTLVAALAAACKEAA